MVFDKSNVNYDDFEPVKNWLDRKDGFLLFGGTKYIAELTRSYRHMRLVRTLKDAGIAVQIKSDQVDSIEDEIKVLTNGTCCNDQHIMALLAAANCSLLCSRDAKLYPFVTQKQYYPKRIKLRVRIYSSARNTNLLSRTKLNNIRNADL